MDLTCYSLVNGDKTLELSGTIPAKGSYLIVGAAESTSDEYLTYDLPEADKTCDWAIDNKSYTIRLMKGNTEIDSVTAGATAETKISKQKSLKRSSKNWICNRSLMLGRTVVSAKMEIATVLPLCAVRLQQRNLKLQPYYYPEPYGYNGENCICNRTPSLRRTVPAAKTVSATVVLLPVVLLFREK